MLLTIGHALRPLEFAVVGRLVDQMATFLDVLQFSPRVTVDDRWDGERLTPEQWVTRFRDQIASKVVFGVFRATRLGPAHVTPLPRIIRRTLVRQFHIGEPMPNDSKLTLDILNAAVASSSAAFRLSLKLEAVSPKVFPPTYEGGKYAVEERMIGGQKLPCVLLDSVPSQANRMELALQDAWEGGEVVLPMVSADFEKVENPGLRKITSLQAPHRIVDAILRDSLLVDGGKGVKFRDSRIGKELNQLSNGYATPLLRYAPHSLVFGMWDSTGPRGGLGVKFARAIVSEVIGVNAVPGVKTSSRIDPLNIRVNSGVLYKAKEGWTLNEATALKEKGKPVKLGKDGKPSEANHGNVTPSISSGGYTIDFAEQTTVLSLPAL
jgi:CRISPR-associated protein Csb1